MITPENAHKIADEAIAAQKCKEEKQRQAALRKAEADNIRITKNLALLLEEADSAITDAAAKGEYFTSVRGWHTDAELKNLLVQDTMERYEVIPRLADALA